jgi:hypothetical protein
MNPRLSEPGFAVVCLHADVPARPGKDENREDDGKGPRQHGRRGYLHHQASRKGDGEHPAASRTTVHTANHRTLTRRA